MKRKKPRRLPTSGDRLIDWHFREIVNILERGIAAIRKKKRLVSTDEKPPRKAVRGLYDYDLEMIFLNAAKSVHPAWQDYVETIIHETYHKIYDKKRLGHKSHVRHKSIDVLAKILMLKLTDEQKRYLKKFIPKKEVKQDPPPAEAVISVKPAPDILPETLPDFEPNGQ